MAGERDFTYTVQWWAVVRICQNLIMDVKQDPLVSIRNAILIAAFLIR